MTLYQKESCPRTGQRWNGMIASLAGGEIATPRCPDCGAEFTWKYGYPTLPPENGCTAEKRKTVLSGINK